MSEEITHKDLVIASEKWLNKRGIKIIFHELVAYTSNNESPDVIGWNSIRSVLIECKASRSDFLADKKKLFRRYPQRGMGDHRIYFCPPDIIKPDDLPEGWGLVYFDGKKTENIHGINGHSLTSWGKAPFSGNKGSEMSMLLSALRRLQLNGFLHKIYDKEPVFPTNAKSKCEEMKDE